MSASDPTTEPSEAVLDDLSRITDQAARTEFLGQHGLFHASFARHLNDASRAKLRVAPRQSLSLAEAAIAIGRALESEELLGPSLRAKANALYVLGDNPAALDYHAQALAIFRKRRDKEEEARTLNASIQPYILLGSYDRALESAKAAKDLFETLGDKRRLAHVEINVGNLCHRQDRFDEALACYERAYEIFLPLADAEGIGIALYNMSVCLISMNDFPRALASYQRARETFVAHGMTLLVGQADYNIAYLYYLRGEYGRAIKMLGAAREQSQANGDAHILALCYLDLSDIYLELNLSSQAAQTAHEGMQRFQKLGMGYEEAKCLANEAIAWSQQGKQLPALELFAQARSVFARENNQVWPWLIDLYRALALFDEGRFFEARKCCKSALEFFGTSTSPGKAVLCALLLSRLELKIGNRADALSRCSDAIDHLSSLDVPILEYQAHYVMGEIHAEAGNQRESYLAYQKSREKLETVRSKLRKEELKIAFVKDKSEVYERLTDICLRRASDPAALQEAFQHIELSKYRSPAEILLSEIHTTPESIPGSSDIVRRLRNLREELNWYHHRIEIAQLSSDQNDPAKIERLQAEARSREQAMIQALQELPESTPGAQLLGKPVVSPLDAVQAALGSDVSLIEYFAIGDQLLAALLTHERLRIFPLSLLSRVAELVRTFRAQLLSVGSGPGLRDPIGQLKTSQHQLLSLHTELLEPLFEHVSGEHLIIVPHGVLHLLPFHALFDGSQYLADRLTVSYAPSATTYALCRTRRTRTSDARLVVGFGSPAEGEIPEDLSAVASALGSPRVFSGDAQAEAGLRELGPSSSVIYMANHRPVSQHDPIPSGKVFGSAHLGLSYLYQLRLQPELIAVTGFAPRLEMNAPETGEEAVALAHCLLESGARSTLSTLWDRTGPRAAQFFKRFFERQAQGLPKAEAYRQTQREVRDLSPHPFYWAGPYLTGDVLPR